jgi:hypothetical protein
MCERTARRLHFLANSCDKVGEFFFACIRIDLPETCKRKVSRRDCLIVIRIWFDIDTLDCATWKFLFRLSEILSDKWQMDDIPIFVVHRFP